MAQAPDLPEELTSDDYGIHVLGRFTEFREEELFCDFTLRVGKDVFKVHRMVLAGCSDYFRAMFSHGMIESKSESLDLHSVPTCGMRPLLDFAYTGRLTLSLKTIPEILAAATFLQITPAIAICSKFLKHKMDFQNAGHLVDLANNFGLTELKEYHRRLILDNFIEFTDTEYFNQLDASTLASYLKEDSLRTTTEAKLLKCALRWYSYDRQSRDPVIHEVLENIRYTIDGWPTIEYALRHEPFKTNKKCREIIRWCERYMQNASRKYLNQSYRSRVRFDKKSLVQMGGMKVHRQESTLGFDLPGEDGESNEGDKHGTGRNHYYHRDLKQWFPLGIIGHCDSRSHNPLVEVNDFAVMVGGYLYTADFQFRTYQHCSNEVKLFTPGGFALWDMPYMNETRAHHVAVAAPGYLYAIGGKNESGPLRSVEQFHMQSEKWQCVAKMEYAVFDHAGTCYQEKVYITGGVVQEQIISSMWCYMHRENEWVESPPMLACRSGHAMTVLDDQLIVCGGHTTVNSPRCLSSVEVYNLELCQWSFITPMRVDCAFITPVVLEGHLLIVGGENSVGDFLDKIQEYNPRTQSWGNYCTSLPEPMKSVGCCAVTIKLTADGEEDTDSIADAYDRRFEASDDDVDYGEYISDDDDDAAEEVEEWRFNVQRRHWPC